jgi:hypothetical protein
MTEDDRLIFGGIITVVSCIIFTIISTILIEKKLPTKKAKLLSYLGLFLLGIILLLIWPFPSEGEKFIITPPTLIGASLAAFTTAAFLVTSQINYELKLAQTLTEDAILMGKSINLTTQGIPEDKKTPFHKLYFFYTGLINNTWNISHFEERELIQSNRTYAEKTNKPNINRYNNYLVYKIRLNQNLDTHIDIVSKKSENDYGYTKQGYQKLNSLFSDLNEHIVIYYKSGEQNILSKLQNPLFRKLLIDHKDYFDIGFDLNIEKGIGNLKVRYFYPQTGMFEFKLKEKFFNHSVEERKAQLKFLAEFLSMFDK